MPLPVRCPPCGGGVEERDIVSQYQTEIPEPRVQRIEFRIHVGRCQRCERRVRSRHERQTSDAIGSAASQLGPRALALATQLNKGLGLPYGKTQAVLAEAFGLRVSRGGLCRALARMAWMWVFSSPQVTVYAIQPGRGFEQAAGVLGADFEGFLVRDGWSVYRQFPRALHQTCLAHLLRRCRERIQLGGAGSQFPRTVQKVLQQALQLRDRREQGCISGHGLAVAQGRLEARLDRALERRYRSPENRRLANHLLRERDAIFTFLNCPGLDATNWRAEQAIRPMVVTRKLWGGNRTERGARTQGILLSVLQTCRQQLRPVSSLLQTLLCSPQPKVLELTGERARMR